MHHSVDEHDTEKQPNRAQLRGNGCRARCSSSGGGTGGGTLLPPPRMTIKDAFEISIARNECNGCKARSKSDGSSG